MGYEESVIIPLELYKKECTKDKKNEAEKILNREDIPADIKIKLFDQARWQKVTKKKKETKEERILSSHALNQIPIAVQPFVRNIVQLYINKNRNVIDWDPKTFELIIDGQLRFGSNIIRSFQNIMRGREDILKEKLLEIGVPREWLTQKIYENNTPIFKTSLDTSREESLLSTPVKWDSKGQTPLKRKLIQQEEEPFSPSKADVKSSLKAESNIRQIRRSTRPTRKPKWINY